MPMEVRNGLKEQMTLIQDAVILRTLLNCFFFEEGKVGFNTIMLGALPKFLTYRLPSVRGKETPYTE